MLLVLVESKRAEAVSALKSLVGPHGPETTLTLFTLNNATGTSFGLGIYEPMNT